MALDVSPDLEAAICYLMVLGVGGLAALFQLYQKLGGVRGAWVMLETWALFTVYALIPVALFWLLDRSNAIHDTSVFGAVAVGVAYQQILSGQLSSIKAPEQVAGFWQFFSAWADRMAARIRDRIRVVGATGAEASQAIADKVKELGLEPFQPPEPWPPIVEEEITLVCWIAVDT
jgi:hypothetical protein